MLSSCQGLCSLPRLVLQNCRGPLGFFGQYQSSQLGSRISSISSFALDGNSELAAPLDIWQQAQDCDLLYVTISGNSAGHIWFWVSPSLCSQGYTLVLHLLCPAFPLCPACLPGLSHTLGHAFLKAVLAACYIPMIWGLPVPRSQPTPKHHIQLYTKQHLPCPHRFSSS